MPADIPFWDGTEFEDLYWETAWLGRNYIPGVVTVEWVTPPTRRIEKKKVKGKDGTKVTDQGDELAEMVMRVEIYNRQQWFEFQEVLPLIWPKSDGAPRKSVEVMHPEPNTFGIKDVYVTSIKSLPPRNGVKVIEIRLLEFKPNPVEVTTAAGRNDQATEKKGDPDEKSYPNFGNAAKSAGESVGGLLNNVSNYFSPGSFSEPPERESFF